MPLHALPGPYHEYLSAETLEHENASIAVLDGEDRIVFVNETWERFAARNGGGRSLRAPDVVGSRWLDGIHGTPARAFFATLLAEAKARRGWGVDERGVIVRGECNSPEVSRDLVTRLAPIIDPATRRTIGMLTLNEIVAERPIEERYPIARPDERRYRDGDGLLLQCCGCRRVRVRGDEDLWEFVPDWIATLRRDASHGMCRTCIELYYGAHLAHQARRRADEVRAEHR